MSGNKLAWGGQLCIFFLLVNSWALADEPKILTWQDLIPTEKVPENPLRDLGLGLRLDIEYIAVARYQERTGQISLVDPDYEYAIELEHKLKSENINFEPLIVKFDAFLDEIELLNKSVVEELNATLVRIPGYAMPLETSNVAIEEFLLVPSIGACIHTPVPPANQMVFVKVGKPYEVKELYEPIWVTGRMRLQHSKSLIQYSDGQGAVETAYTIQSANIELYED